MTHHRFLRNGIVSIALPAATVGLATLAVMAQPPAGGGSRAIFTTTPDDSIVNENVRYEGRHYVYLDGSPRQNGSLHSSRTGRGLLRLQAPRAQGARAR